MTREELIGTNANIVKSVVQNVLQVFARCHHHRGVEPDGYHDLPCTAIQRVAQKQIIGMGGILDSARFKYYLSKALGCSPQDLNAIVIGGHGDTTMIPLIRYATWNSLPVSNLLNAEQQQQIVSDTMVGGATLTKLIGTSAWYAPGAAVSALVRAVVHDEKKLFSCCVALEGEYGQSDICLGVPVVIGSNGWERIIDYSLNEEEAALFGKSADAVRNMNDVLKTL